MTAIRRLPTFVLACVLVLFALVIAVPLTGAKGGNSSNAEACQKGGWEQLAASDDPFTAFVNQDACVSAGAQGAVLVPVVTSHVVVHRDVSGFTFMGRSLCGVTATLIDPGPDTTGFTFNAVFNNGVLFEGTVVGVSSHISLVYRDTDEYLITTATATAQPGGAALPVRVIDTCPM